MKELRKSKNLIQKAFVKKFFVKENTISNYENGIRNPSVEFLTQVCKEFGLTLDYFEKGIQQESNPKNLVITTKYGKQAIFDAKQSCYLTPHIYENICLSKYGYHLLLNRNKQGQITYSAMVDNWGNVTEYKDIALGNNGCFDRFGKYFRILQKI